MPEALRGARARLQSSVLDEGPTPRSAGLSQDRMQRPDAQAQPTTKVGRHPEELNLKRSGVLPTLRPGEIQPAFGGQPLFHEDFTEARINYGRQSGFCGDGMGEDYSWMCIVNSVSRAS